MASPLLAGDKWQKLPDPESSADAVTKLVWRKLGAEAKKIGKKLESLGSVMQQWRVLRWLDNDTFEGYMSDEYEGLAHPDDADMRRFRCAAEFKGKCDNRGGWKVLAPHILSDAEDKKIAPKDE